ncbi:MBG domain-containing protein, partial [Jingyaoa shaoxingensis]
NTLTEGTDYKVSYDTDNFVDVKTITVTITGEGSYSGSVTRIYRITPKPATVTADDKSKVYGDADPELTATDSGLLGTDKVTYTLGRETGEKEGTYAITPSGEEAQGNYTVTYYPGTLTITAQSIVPEDPSYRGVTVDDPRDHEYDAQEHKWTPTVTDKEGNKLTEGSDYTVSYDTENFVDVKTINVTITGKGSYSGSVTRAYKITPASATVTANNKNKMFGEADPELTADVSGLYGTDKVGYTLSREPGENVGDYVITASGEADQGNYTVTYNPGTLTITRKGTLTVTGTSYEGTYDGNEHGSAASANVTEGTVISYKVGDGDWTAEAPTIKDVGSKEVTVKAENPNYVTAEATYTLTVNPKDVTVTADNKSKVYGDADPKLTATDSGLLGTDKVTYTLDREAGEKEGTYAITPSGEEIQGNYTVTYNPGTLTITAQSIVPDDPSYRGVTVDDPRDHEYDAQEHKWTPTVTDKDGNTLTEGTDYKVSYDTDNFVDVKTITVTITGEGSYSGSVT